MLGCNNGGGGGNLSKVKHVFAKWIGRRGHWSGPMSRYTCNFFGPICPQIKFMHHVAHKQIDPCYMVCGNSSSTFFIFFPPGLTFSSRPYQNFSKGWNLPLKKLSQHFFHQITTPSGPLVETCAKVHKIHRIFTRHSVQMDSRYLIHKG